MLTQYELFRRPPETAMRQTLLHLRTTLNDPAFVECAGGLALRMMRRREEGVEGKVAYGVRICLSRQPKGRGLASAW